MIIDEKTKESMCPIQYLQNKCVELQKQNKNSYHADRETWDFIDILSCKDNLAEHIFDKCKRWNDKNECWNKYLELINKNS